jgi:tetratricopeptide (TPR) repeat protein
MEMALDSLWGHLDRDARGKFPATIRGLTRRGLTAAIVSRSNLNSSQLAIEALTSAKAVARLAMGVCEAYFESLVVRFASNETQAVDLRDRSLWRRAPSHPDSDFCSSCRNGQELTESARSAQCEIQGFIQLLKRFEGFPEEPEPRSVGLLALARAPNESAVSIQPPAFRGGLGAQEESQEHFDRATELAKAGRLEEAALEYRRAHEVSPTNAQAVMYEGNCLFNLGRREEALDALDQAAGMRPDVGIIWESRANVLNSMDRDDEAIESYERAISRDRELVRSRVELARFRIEFGQNQRALELLDAALRLEPNHWYALAKRGLALYNLGRVEEADESFRRALQLNPSHAETLNNYGLVLERLGNIEGARKHYAESLREAPGYRPATINLGRLGK